MEWAQAGALVRRDEACSRIEGLWARIRWPGSHQVPASSHRNHTWAPKQAPARVGTRASTHMPLLHLPGQRTPKLHLTLSYTPMEAPSAFLGPQRSVTVPVRPHARACSAKRTAAKTGGSSLLPSLHTQRASAVNFGRTKELFGRGEPQRATLQEERGGADRRQRISSSHKQLPKDRGVILILGVRPV